MSSIAGDAAESTNKPHPEKVSRKVKKPKGYKEDPYVFIDPKDEALVQTGIFYELAKDFPASQLLCRFDTYNFSSFGALSIPGTVFGGKFDNDACFTIIVGHESYVLISRFVPNLIPI